MEPRPIQRPLELRVRTREARSSLLLASADRLHDLLRAVKALGGGVPDLIDDPLRGTIAFGPRGDLFLLRREVDALKVLLNVPHRAEVVHRCSPSLAFYVVFCVPVGDQRKHTSAVQKHPAARSRGLVMLGREAFVPGVQRLAGFGERVKVLAWRTK